MLNNSEPYEMANEKARPLRQEFFLQPLASDAPESGRKMKFLPKIVQKI